MIDFDPVLQKLRDAVMRHRVGMGAYARFTITAEERPRSTAASPYGCADAADMLYMLGDFSTDPEERAAAVRVLQNFQEHGTGLFYDLPNPGIYCHHPCYATAMRISARGSVFRRWIGFFR